MEECEMDFRVVGKWHFCLRSPNEGDESWELATYKEIDKPRKIVYQDNFSDEDGNINEEMPGMLVTVELFDHQGKPGMSAQLFLILLKHARKLSKWVWSKA